MLLPRTRPTHTQRLCEGEDDDVEDVEEDYGASQEEDAGPHPLLFGLNATKVQD